METTETELLRLFGKRLREARCALGITQAELARWLNVRQSTISEYETGVYAPELPLLWRIAQVLHVPVGYFFPPERGAVWNEREAAEFALIQGLSPQLRQFVWLLIVQLLKAQQGQPIVNERLLREERLTALRFLERDARQVQWKALAAGFDAVPLELLAQFAALLLLGGLRGWSANLDLEDDDEAAV
jgi:transcriptional regulator with XRE-family HTH domain